MTQYTKFLPPADLPEFHAPFWESVNAHAVRIQQCVDCSTLRFIPRELCPQCFSADAEWVPIAGRGEVFSYTIVHRAPTPAYQADAPYVIAHVTLAEGPRMIANLIGIAPEDVRIGMPVSITYFDVGEGKSLFAFTPSA